MYTFRRKLFKSGSAIAKKWANTRNIIMRINDIIFVHGGIVPENTNLQDKNIINYLNFIAREFLKGNKKKRRHRSGKYFI